MSTRPIVPPMNRVPTAIPAAPPPATSGSGAAQSDPATRLTQLVADVDSLKGSIRSLQDETSVQRQEISYLKGRFTQKRQAEKNLDEIDLEISKIVVLFGQNSSDPANRGEYEQRIGQIVDRLKENPHFVLIIQGHSNPHWWGGAALDMKRSKERAMAVYTSILNAIQNPEKKQAIADRLKMENKGCMEPVAEDKDPLNCRATFSIKTRKLDVDEEKEPVFHPEPRSEDDRASVVSRRMPSRAGSLNGPR